MGGLTARTYPVHCVVRHRKLFWFSVLASFAAVCILSFGREWGHPHIYKAPWAPSDPVFSVAFLGYSNDASGQKWALLAVTNRDFGNLYFCGPYLEELSTDPPGGPTNHRPEMHWQHPGGIAPGSFCTVAVETPAAVGKWRVRCVLIRRTWQDDLHNCRWCPESLIPVRRSYATGGLVSDWMSL